MNLGHHLERPVMNCLRHGMTQGVVPDQNQICIIYLYFSRYNRQSGFFWVIFNSTFARPDFNGAVQCCNIVKPAYNCTTMDQFFGFCCCYHHCCYSCCCRQVPFHRGWSLADWSITVSSQTLLDSSQDPLNTIDVFLKHFLSIHQMPWSSLLPPCTILPDMGRFLAYTLSKPLRHSLIAFQFSLVFISLSHYYHLATGVLFLSWLLMSYTWRVFPTLNFATICFPVSFSVRLASFFFYVCVEIKHYYFLCRPGLQLN